MKSFDEDKARRLVELALEGGVNLFDTGPNYSGGNAEARLGRILKGRTGQVTVSTKVGTQLVGGRHVKDFSPQGIEQSVLTSLRRLQLDHIPLLHFHGFPEPADAAIETVLKLKDRGLVGHLGVSTGNAGARKVLGAGVFDSLMIEYNIINRTTPARLIDAAHEAGMGVLIKSPLAQTLYSRDIFKLKAPSDVWYLLRAMRNHRSKFLAGRKYRFINDIEGMKGSEVALAYVLNNQHVTSAVVGTVNPDHLLTNLRAADKELPADLVRQIESR